MRPTIVFRLLFLATWLVTVLANAAAPPSIAAAAGVAYPNAGWLPYAKGPMVTTVASMYGPNPLTSCAIKPPPGQAAFGSTCLVANSAAIVASVWGTYGAGTGVEDQLLGGTNDYRQIWDAGRYSAGASTYFQGTASDPKFCVPAGVGYFKSANPSGTVHIPAGAMPQMNSDHHLYVYDTTTGTHWSAWISGRPGESGATCPNGLPLWSTPAHADATPSGGPGTIDAAVDGKPGPVNTEGIGLSGTAGNISLEWSIRAQDVLAGRIPHALILQGDCDTEGTNGKGIFWYPVIRNKDYGATDNSHFCTSSTTNLDYGAHVWLDTAPASAQRGTPNCDILTYAIVRALNEFGAYKNDIGPDKLGADDYISYLAMADINDTYDGNPYGYSRANSPWYTVLTQMQKSGGVMNDRAAWTSPPTAGGRYQLTLPVTPCGIDLTRHMHVLIAPKAN